MKKLILIFGMLTAIIITACQDQEATQAPQDELNREAIKNALKVLTTTQNFDRLGFGGGTNTGKQTNARQTNQIKSLNATARTRQDSSNWESCAEEEYIDHGNGSYTWIIDYGEEGCEEFGYFMKGKIIETVTQSDDNVFQGKTEYVNFGDEYHTINGSYDYTSTWTETGDPNDSTTWEFSGSYEYSENLTIAITEEDYNETFTIVASGKETYDQNGHTVESSNVSYSLENGDAYTSEVTTPLYFSYECAQLEDDWVFIYVSGVEHNTYQSGDESGEFTVDYGDGTCDNIITVTQDGVSEDIDLGEEWEDAWDEDGSGDDGSS